MSVWLASNCFTSVEPHDLNSVIFHRSIPLTVLLIPDLPVNTWQGIKAVLVQHASRLARAPCISHPAAMDWSVSRRVWAGSTWVPVRQGRPRFLALWCGASALCSVRTMISPYRHILWCAACGGLSFRDVATSSSLSSTSSAGHYMTCQSSAVLGWTVCIVRSVSLLTPSSPAHGDLSGPDPSRYLVVTKYLLGSWHLSSKRHLISSRLDNIESNHLTRVLKHWKHIGCTALQ